MARSYYSNSISEFLQQPTEEILGVLSTANQFTLEREQRDAWLEEIRVLKSILPGFSGSLFFEFDIPRMGKRIDVVLISGPVLFLLEFKVGEDHYPSYAIDQVVDYALDLKNFHETSHNLIIAPLLICTEAAAEIISAHRTAHEDGILAPIRCNSVSLLDAINRVLGFVEGSTIEESTWENGRYRPTPTIIEAAMALYRGHSVEEITKSDADEDTIRVTTQAISDAITYSKEHHKKSICFVTGVPGAGKTLVGLNIANGRAKGLVRDQSVFLSGNGPLVMILQEALARDRVLQSKVGEKRVSKTDAKRSVRSFVQNIHHFRDEYVRNPKAVPPEHVVIFDEAQRAWTLGKTADFMKRRKGRVGFSQSEPEFLISCVDRHKDWAVIICLVGGGQEIHTGEAGIGEWIESLNRSYPEWKIFISSRLTDSEYGAGEVLEALDGRGGVTYDDNLHLAVSMRSFRAENVSLLVKQILDLDLEQARQTLASLHRKYPIVITRDMAKAKRWLKHKARGSERFGMVASSQAERLRPNAIFVKAPMNPIHWFLAGKEDTRSSYYLEDVATEFSIQGLELDWTCVTWDADFRHSGNGWVHRSFVGSRWNRINKEERKLYQKNAYRVLLTRARQGMVIVVPEGEQEDPTRLPRFYDPTFDYLKSIGLQTI